MAKPLEALFVKMAAPEIPSPRLPHVLMVIPGDADNLISMVFVRRQAEAIARTGCRVENFYLGTRKAPLALARKLQWFRRVLKESQPDLVHAHFGTLTAFFCTIGTLKPLVVTYRGSDLNPAPSDNWLRHQIGVLLSQLSALRAQRIICVSPQLRSLLWWPPARRRTEIIPMGVNLDFFNPSPCDQARQQLGWSRMERVVLFNAGSSPQVKRLDLAEAAVQAAQADCPGIRLVKLSGDVEPDQIPLFLSAADVLLMTSDYEGSPNIVKEAMACGLPVVSVDVGDVTERLRDVYPSKIVGRNSQELGKALVEVLNLNCRSNGREIAQREFSDPLIVDRILAVYQRC